MFLRKLNLGSRIKLLHKVLPGVLLVCCSFVLGQSAAPAAPNTGGNVVTGDTDKATQEAKKTDAQTAANENKKNAAKAATGGTALNATTNVKDNVDIQAVLLPRKQAEKVFSKEIAKHYAVVQVTIDNKSKDASFVLQSLFADYSSWALSGVPAWFSQGGTSSPSAPVTATGASSSTTPSATATGTPATPAVTGTTSSSATTSGATASTASNSSVSTTTSATASSGGSCPQGSISASGTAFQSVSCGGQVASIESRVIRGELLDASTWTVRNGLVRAAVLVGTVASGIPAFGSKNAVKYVGDYNGQFIPGLEVFWPDGTVAQLNRVSDFGFQTNKIVPKDSSDIVYAFFPLDRFFTPGMKKIFLNSPAVFFSPSQIFVDKHMGKMQSQVDEMKNLIEDLTSNVCSAIKKKVSDIDDTNLCPQSNDDQDKRDEKMIGLLTMDCSQHADKNGNFVPGATKKDDDPTYLACMVALPAQKLINHVSLNSTNVLAQGVMTVDVSIVPATITDITFEEGNNKKDVWTVAGKDHAATITGSFLTNGVPSITSIEVPDKADAKIADYLDDQKGISVVSDGSTDSKLNFKIQWKAGSQIPSGSKLHFQVTKYDAKDTKKTSGVKSMDYIFEVDYSAPAAGDGNQQAPANTGNAGAGNPSNPTATNNGTNPAPADKKKRKP